MPVQARKNACCGDVRRRTSCWPGVLLLRWSGGNGIGREADSGGSRVLAFYFALSVLFFGRALFGHFSDRYIGGGPDPSQFMWYIRWWPHAITHGLNPFLPHGIFVPSGSNIAWTSSIPLASIAAWPLTATIGLIPTYNLLCLAAPALAGWTAFILCRYITKAYWPSVLSGFLFGFSSFMAGKMLGGLNVAFVFPVPLAVWLALRRFQNDLGIGKFILMLAAVIVMQFLLFIETFATMTFVGGLAILLAMGLTADDTRARIAALIPPIAASYATAAVVLSPYLYHLFAFKIRPPQIMPTEEFSADFLNFLVPTPASEAGRLHIFRAISTNYRCGVIEAGSYVAFPLIVITILFARRHWREPQGKLLIDLLLLICVFSMGARLQIDGKLTAGMPWTIFSGLPFIEKALPTRFAIYLFLDLAIITAFWMSTIAAGTAAQVGIATATILLMLPNLSARFWTTDANMPDFFATDLYRRYLVPEETVVILPYVLHSDSMLWQAETGMYFRMAGGYIGFPPVPPQYEQWPIVWAAYNEAEIPDAGDQFKAFLANHNVGAVIVVSEGTEVTWEFTRGNLEPPKWRHMPVSSHEMRLWQGWLAALGVAPIDAGGVELYQIPRDMLAPYLQMTPLEMETRNNAARFDSLVLAADAWLSGGHDPEKLSPLRAQRMNLIPPGWVGGHFTVTNPEDLAMADNLLLTQWSNGRFAVGVMGTYPSLRTIAGKYGPMAKAIYYITADLPVRVATTPWTQGPQVLAMTFDRGMLRKMAMQIKSRHGSSNPGPIVEGTHTSPRARLVGAE
jgi:hypothetical protein